MRARIKGSTSPLDSIFLIMLQCEHTEGDIMAASNRWNLSTDYYDVLPADSEMDGEDRCDICDGYPLSDNYYVSPDEVCECE